MIIRVILIALTLTSLLQISFSAFLPAAIGLAKTVKDGVDTLWNIKDLVDPPVDIDDVYTAQKDLMSNISVINNKIDQLDKMINTLIFESRFNLKDSLSSSIRLNLRIDKLIDLVSIINVADNNFKEYLGVLNCENLTTLTLERHTLEDFATKVVSHDPDSVKGVMDQLHGLIHPDTNQGSVLLPRSLLILLAESLKESEKSLCHIQQSPYDIVYQLYTLLQVTQLKGFTMMQFSWMLLKLYNKGTFTVESRIQRELYSRRMVEQEHSLKYALRLSDSDFWRCDPNEHVVDNTYIELKMFLQMYMEDQKILPKRCLILAWCLYYMHNNKRLDENPFGHCYGPTFECEPDWPKVKKVCHTSNYKQSEKRIDGIYAVKLKNGSFLGDFNSCDEHHVESLSTTFTKICLCDNERNEYTVRRFSLDSVHSTTYDNKVITGIRFVEVNSIFHMQIQEGVLESQGHINQSTVSWKPVNSDVRAFMTMNYNQRAINLDNIKAPPEHVVTGVIFTEINGHLTLEIKVSPFNFTSGELLYRNARWLSDRNKERSELLLESPDVPTKTTIPSRIDSNNNQFIRFTHSDFGLDAGQTAVPFLDAQDVAPQPAVPLSGVGVYHKGRKGFGGFIGLKVFTYRYGDHM